MGIIGALGSIIDTVINTILVLGAAVIWGIIIALIIGFLILLMVRIRDRNKKS